jgi:hypothetical protein
MPHLFQQTVTDLSEVPEPFHGLYQKEGDGYTMAPEVFSHVDPTGFNTVLEQTRKKLASLRRTTEAFQSLGDSPETIAERMAQLEDMATKGGKDAQAFEKWKNDISSKHQEELTQKEKQLADMMRSLEEHLVDAEATMAISANEGNPVLLLDQVKKRTKVVNENGKYQVRIVDNEGDPRINGSGGYMSIKDFVSELKNKSEYAGAFRASGNTGSGSKPGAASASNVPGGAFRITREDARDPMKYRRVRDEAAKVGRSVEIID